MTTPQNTLYYGDNLTILREYIATASVDLVYLDPPFNSSKNYNLLFKEKSGQASAAQLEAFADTWQWDQAAAATYNALRTNAPAPVRQAINALHDMISTTDMLAYLVMMAARLVELHRVLKPTGSLYLHCDPTAVHYLKIVLDSIFGVENYRDQIVWRRTSAHSDSKGYGNNYDTILFYSKSKSYTWNKIYQPYDPEYVEKYYRYKDPDGRHYASGDVAAAGPGPARYFNGVLRDPPPGSHWRFSQEKIDRYVAEGRIFFTANGFPRFKRYLDEMPGMPVQSLWADIQPVVSWSKEGLGYPTQKPQALLERIISASSNPGDLVLDPFCGCGTAVVAAQKLGRRWIGIDITHLAIALMRKRLQDTFGASATYRVRGEPEDLESARALAQESEHDGRYQFQWWALSLIKAQPEGGEGGKTGKKGSDKGIDGRIPFIEADGTMREVIVSVKSGHVTASMVRDLAGVLTQNQHAAIGVFITLEPPTADMRKVVATAGYYHSDWTGQDYPQLQILTIADLLASKQVQMPPTGQAPGATAPRAKQSVEQGKFA